MTPHIHTVSVDFRAKTADEMLWDDGETCEPFDFSDPLADMSPVEREQYESEMSAYYRKESARLEKEWRQGETPNWKHRWEEAGGDIADFARDHSDTPAGADYIAKACGYHQTTWDDQRNVTRRAKVATKKRQDTHKAQQLRDNKVLHSSEPVKIPKLCAKCDKINYIEAGRTICNFCEETPKTMSIQVFIDEARKQLEAAAAAGIIGKKKVESMLVYYTELFSTKQNDITVLELLEKSIAAKAARK